MSLSSMASLIPLPFNLPMASCLRAASLMSPSMMARVSFSSPNEVMQGSGLLAAFLAFIASMSTTISPQNSFSSIFAVKSSATFPKNVPWDNVSILFTGISSSSEKESWILSLSSDRVWLWRSRNSRPNILDISLAVLPLTWPEMMLPTALKMTLAYFSP